MGAPTKKKRRAGGIKDPIFRAGYEEGVRETRTKALTFLEQKYMSPEVVRETPYAKALLEIAGELAKELKVF